MADRYFSSEPLGAPTITLTGSEAHHLLHVMRAEPGHAVVLFDGRGGEYPGIVKQCLRAAVELDVGPQRPVERELAFSLTLAVCLPKGDRARWLVEKAVEMGVSQLVPLQTERSVAAGLSPDKLTRYVIEASKQCGRNRLMEVTDRQKWSELAKGKSAVHRLVAHPGGPSPAGLELSPHGDVVVAIGPEGGLTQSEVDQASQQGWQVVGLGKRILRIETAALALAAFVALRNEEQ